MNITALFQKSNQSHSIYDNESLIDPIIIKKTFNLISSVEQQFYQNKNADFLKIFERAAQIMYFSRIDQFSNKKYNSKSPLIKSFNYLSLKQPFDIMRLTLMNIKQTQKISMQSVRYVEQKINCEELSFYFLLPQKFLIYYTRRDKIKIKKVFDLIFSSFQCALWNLNIFVKICDERIKIEHFCAANKVYNLIEKKKQIVIKLLQIFAQNPLMYIGNSIRCLNILIQCDGLKNWKRDQNEVEFNEQIIFFQRMLDKYLTKIGLHILTYIFWAHLLIRLRQDYQRKGKYYIVRLQVIKKVLYLTEKSAKYYLNIQEKNLLKVHIKSNQAQIKQSLLIKYQSQFQNVEKSVYLMSDFLQSQEEKQTIFTQQYWKIKKIKMNLFKQCRVIRYFDNLSKYLFDSGKFQEVFQVLVQYCVECFERNGAVNYKYLFRDLKNIKSCLLYQSAINFAHHFTNYLLKVQSLYNEVINPILLLPLYVSLLYFDPYLDNRPKIRKMMYLKAYKTYEKLKTFKLKEIDDMQKFTIRQQTIQEILYLSVNFTEKLKLTRKKRILIRKLLSSINNCALYDLNKFDFYVQTFTCPPIKSSSSLSFTQNKINSAHLTASKRFILMFLLASDQFTQNIKRIFAHQSFSQYYDFEMNQRNVQREKILLQIKEKNKQFSKYITKDHDPIIAETVQIRKILMKKELQMLCNKLYRQKKLKFEQITWIKKLNY